ncbi:hypothetical protein COCVIDRAFT_114175 [Bipolaris victoriae FI3]|uniref:Acyl-CoA dehydrogenase/oxidase C-terminal domain-containing protein n=1 Tax=Bipolaris victoriae (strain FI3) TaxID=930091 RepID=W7E2M4_BIPV3|nr:hypothetical protein COCVIDRAFT_114175 [Bipolaris victoriae FI3]
MTNFNHERLMIYIGVTRQARVALSSAFKYVTQRKAFKKTLIEQPVVRNRLARCARKLEAHSAWLDQLIFQRDHLSKSDADRELGGLTALAKARSGTILDDCARCVVLLFGGNGITVSGQGELVEKLSREAPCARIPGGSEDVMLDLAIRQIHKNFEHRKRIQGQNPKL